MASITFFSWLAVVLGVIVSVKTADLIGGGGFGKCFGLAFIAGGLGIGLCIGAGTAHTLCHGVLKICEPTSDTTVFTLSYPIIAVPLYWLAMFLTLRHATSLRRATLQVRETSGPALAVEEALANFRAGRKVHTYCPSCRSPVSVTSDTVQYSSESTRVGVACECHACDGAYELAKQAR